MNRALLPVVSTHARVVVQRLISSARIFHELVNSKLDNSMGDFNKWIFEFIDKHNLSEEFRKYIEEKMNN